MRIFRNVSFSGITLVVTFPVIAAIAMLWWSGGGQTSATVAAQVDPGIVQPPLKADVAKFMRQKLATMNLTMEGVSTDDFEMVRDGALKLIELSKQAAWKQHANAAYIQDTADLVEVAEFLVRMAAAQDQQGVAMGYAKLSLSCTTCHQHVRGPKLAVLQRDDNAIAGR
ncbi:MAG: hypothetical protein R3C19_02605 [Planctomycetaceae bacterium]